MDPYISHQQYLLRELNKLSLDKKNVCLEFGTGDGSSSVLKDFLEKNQNLTVYSYESNYDWYISMSSKYKMNNYYFNFVYNWNDFFERKLFNEIYDLAFVDQTPWDARIKTIKLLTDKTKVFILHDYCFFNKGIIENILDTGKNSFFYTNFNENFIMEENYDINFCKSCPADCSFPPTLILRNKKYL